MKKEDEYYYDAMECLAMGDTGQASKLLRKALAFDPDNIQTFLGLAEVYHAKNDRKNAYGWIEKAFKKVKKQFSVWPKKLPWSDIDNRAYLRVIAHWADFLYDSGKKKEAMMLYGQILKMNPNDNQGIRYLLAGIYAGLDGIDVNRMFDDGNRKQDWSKLEQMLKEQNKIHKFWKHKTR